MQEIIHIPDTDSVLFGGWSTKPCCAATLLLPYTNDILCRLKPPNHVVQKHLYFLIQKASVSQQDCLHMPHGGS